MTDDLGPEDRTLGTALSRAVEAQSVRETRFEDSRLGLNLNKRKRGSFLLPAFATIAAVLVGLFVGTSLLDRGAAPSQVATSPTPTVAGSPVPSSTSAAASPDTFVPLLLYFGRDGLPPVARSFQWTPLGAAPADRIRERVTALLTARNEDAPSGATNAVSVRRPGSAQPTVRVTAQVTGDLATVDIVISDGWQIRGAAASQAAVQQLVYTITEEPGINRATINSNGMPAIIDQQTLGKPLKREDVSGYSVPAELRLDVQDEAPRSATATTTVSNEVVAPALGRLAIELRPTTPVQGGFWSPPLTAQLLPTIPAGGGSKWALSVTLPGVTDPRSGSLQGAGPFQEVDGSPIRGLRIRNEGSGVTYEIYLDDARPWRISAEPGTAAGTMRLLVDIGGHPSAVANGTAVYSPRPGSTVSRSFTVSGAARAFEATVSWRVRDSAGRDVAKGFTNATVGTSAVWGTFSTQIQLPASVSGNVTLDVFQASPRDGSDTNKVEIGLEVR